MSEDNKEEITNTDPECVEVPNPAELTVEDVLNDYSHLGLDQQVQSLLTDLYSAR